MMTVQGSAGRRRRPWSQSWTLVAVGMVCGVVPGIALVWRRPRTPLSTRLLVTAAAVPWTLFLFGIATAPTSYTVTP